mmetsp:Transcript_7169/g.11658  ORF Transcript_7169/g.11658 Transcript_7169/m.11658 type:complete len:238 (+) Transcript_7169:223-936(+)
MSLRNILQPSRCHQRQYSLRRNPSQRRTMVPRFQRCQPMGIGGGNIHLSAIYRFARSQKARMGYHRRVPGARSRRGGHHPERAVLRRFVQHRCVGSVHGLGKAGGDGRRGGRHDARDHRSSRGERARRDRREGSRERRRERRGVLPQRRPRLPKTGKGRDRRLPTHLVLLGARLDGHVVRGCHTVLRELQSHGPLSVCGVLSQWECAGGVAREYGDRVGRGGVGAREWSDEYVGADW